MKSRPPGFVSPRTNPDVVMMICTAGHVDHGKTQLVKLLTGCNTDRLKTEQERGLTIELGFAPCYLGSDLCVGIVDVPGHEKFVKNMVAGVSGIDLAVLVVAADDGIMPQTVEHLQIMELLGVRRGLVALTKIDLVSPEDAGERSAEISEFLSGTFLESCPICPVSSETFEGYPEFYEVLVREIRSLAKRPRCGVFRMPIERVFTRKGFGAVATGIPIAGSIEIDAEVELVPGRQRGHVRGIQRFLRDVERGEYGQCLALNIPEFNRRPPARGQVICLPGYLTPSSAFHVRIKTVPGLQKPLRNAEEIKFHTGTSEEAGKIYLLEAKELGAGQSALATIVLHNAVAATAHDRCLIRRASPAATVAGGEILAVANAEWRKKKRQVAMRLKEYLATIEGLDPVTVEAVDRRIAHFLRIEKPLGSLAGEVATALLLPPDVGGERLARLVQTGQLLALTEDYFVHTEAHRSLLAEVDAYMERTLRDEKTLSVTLSYLHKNFDWPKQLWNRIQDDLERKGTVRRQGDKLILQDAASALDAADREIIDRLLAVYEKTGYKSPRPDALPEMLGAPPERVDRLLDYLCDERQLVRLSRQVVLSYAHFKQAQDRVVEIIAEKGELDSADFKHEIDSTRKYALAILDFLDSRRVTLRIGNKRRLAPDYQRNLL